METKKNKNQAITGPKEAPFLIKNHLNANFLKANKENITKHVITIIESCNKGIFDRETAKNLYTALHTQAYIKVNIIIEEVQDSQGATLDDAINVAKHEMLEFNKQFAKDMKKQLEHHKKENPKIINDSFINSIARAIKSFFAMILNKLNSNLGNKGVVKTFHDALSKMTIEENTQYVYLNKTEDDQNIFISDLKKALKPYYSMQKSKLNKNSTTTEPHEEHHVHQYEATMHVGSVEETIDNLSPSHRDETISSITQDANVTNYQETNGRGK